MGYARFTKGTTALLLELTLVAQAWGFLDAILAKYASSHSEVLRLFTAHVTPGQSIRPYGPRRWSS
jgi:hypothetical protein